MPTWFILTISSIIVLAVAEIAQKVAVTRKDNISAEANNTIVWFVQGVLSLIYFLIFAYTPIHALSVGVIIKLLLMSSVYFWAGTLFYTSYKTGSASVNSILLSSSVIVSTILGIIFFNESTSITKLVGSLIIIGSIIYLNYDRKSKLTTGNYYALSGAVLYGIAFTLDKSIAITLSPHLYQIFFSFFIGFAGLLYRGRTILKDLSKIGRDTFLAASVAALSFFLWNKLNFVSYTVGGEVGRIDSINSSVIFLIILLEFFILKDKSNLTKKIVSAVVAFIGVSLLALAK
jgi:drug/metabolite transporter (DMT)-like permease